MSTLKLKIKEQIIDIDYELVPDNLVVEQVSQSPSATVGSIPVVLTPQQTVEEKGIIDITTTFYSDLAIKGVVRLEDKKTYRVKQIKTVKARPLPMYIICEGGQATLLIGEEYYDTTTGTQDGHLFDIDDNSIVVIENVNICQPPQLKRSQPFTPSLFRAKADPSISWRVVVKNCDTTVHGRNGGWGLGFLYGSTKGNYAGLINFKHSGGGLSDAKNEWENLDTSLYLVYDNVKTDFLNQEEFGSSIIKTKGKVEGNRLIITDPQVTTKAFLDNYNFGESSWNNNMVFLIHIDKYTFLWDCKRANIDDKTIALRTLATGTLNVFVDKGRLFIPQREAHVGMSFTVNDRAYTIIEKNRTDYPEWAAWGSDPVTRKVNELAYLVSPSLPDGDYTALFDNGSLNLSEQDMYLIFKGNNHFRTNNNTKFGDWQVLQADIVGHLSYNHANISIWARNTEHNGFYRQSTSDKNVAKSKMMNFINCVGFKDQFNPSIPVTNDPSIPMPKQISELL